MNQKDKNIHLVAGASNFVVDGFKFAPPVPGKSQYFLTHFHGDHYGGLSDKWQSGTIWCTKITASLIIQQLKVQKDIVKEISVGETTVIDGVEVTALDANHCPGAVMLLFHIQETGDVHLHCGDMRFYEEMKGYVALKKVKVKNLYLDTTYALERHSFLSQKESITLVVEAVRDFFSTHSTSGVVCISAYNIGKERMITAVMDALGLKCYVDERKLSMLRLLGPDYLQRVTDGSFTTDPSETPLHVVGMGFAGGLWPFFQADFDNPRAYLASLPVADGKERPSAALCIIPTGWATSSNYNRNHQLQVDGSITVQAVPYSEHSSADELTSFVRFIKPEKIIPTVYKDDNAKRAIEKRFNNLTDHIAAKRSFINLFAPKRRVSSSQVKSPSITDMTTTTAPAVRTKASVATIAATAAETTTKKTSFIDLVNSSSDDDGGGDGDDHDHTDGEKPKKARLT